ncbi:MAG: cytochrome c family protein [Thermodesulfobacteriota bacterium]
MTKKILVTILSGWLAVAFIGTAIAAEGGNERKGKYTYRKVYKACFERGAVESEKPPISPDAKTQAQWDRVFKKKNFEEFGCADEWNKLSEAELQDIQAYLHAHAADSPSPAKCK